MLLKMVGLQVTPLLPFIPSPGRPLPNLCPPLLRTLWRCLSAAPCITEPGQGRSKGVGKGGAHLFPNLPCALTSLPPLPVMYSPFSFGFTSPILNVRRNILSLTSLSVSVALLFSGPFVVFRPSSTAWRGNPCK